MYWKESEEFNKVWEGIFDMAVHFLEIFYMTFIRLLV